MDDINIPVFAQAKIEYTKQIIDILYINMFDGIRSIYEDSKQIFLKQTKISNVDVLIPTTFLKGGLGNMKCKINPILEFVTLARERGLHTNEYE